MIADEDDVAGIADDDDVPGAAEADDGMAEEDEVAWKAEEDSAVLVLDNAQPEILDECGASNVAGAVVFMVTILKFGALGTGIVVSTTVASPVLLLSWSGINYDILVAAPINI